MLLGWLRAMGKAPKKVFVNHGEDQVCDGFAKEIEEKLGYPAVAPYSGDEYDTAKKGFTNAAAIVPVKKKQPANKANPVYDKLYSAGQRLLSVIQKNKGLANRELEKFTNKIKKLCDEYDR